MLTLGLNGYIVDLKLKVIVFMNKRIYLRRTFVMAVGFILFAVLFLGYFSNTVKASVLNSKGDFFIKVDDKVYFRKFDKKALERTALWGCYLDYPTGNGKSFIASYDLKTGAFKKEFDENGYKLNYYDGYFYTDKDDGSGNYTYESYCFDKNGKNVKKIGRGNFVGVSQSGVVILSETIGNNTTLKSYKAEKTEEIISNENSLEVIGIEEDYLIYSHYDKDYKNRLIYCKDLNSEGQSVSLGSIKTLVKGTNLFKVKNILLKGTKLYISAVYTEGSGNYLSKTLVYQADLNKTGSLKKRSDIALKPGDFPLSDIHFDKNGKFKKAEYLGGELAEEENNLYLSDNKNQLKLIAKDFLPKSKSNNLKYSAEHMVKIDDYIFMIVNKEKYNPKESIGWRDAYTVLERQYIVMSLDKPNSKKVLYKDKF